MSNPLVGSTVLSQITVTDPTTGELVNGTVVLTIRDPDGDESVEVPTNPSTGIYQYLLPLDAEGWFYAIWSVTVAGLTTIAVCQVCADEYFPAAV